MSYESCLAIPTLRTRKVGIVHYLLSIDYTILVMTI